MTRQWWLAALCPVTLAAAAAAPAQPQVVTIQGSASAYDARRDDTAARIVVGRAELARFGDASVGEVLKRQPGITIDASGAIAMRGLAKGYTQVLVNGDKAPPGFAIDAIAPDLIERIEISRTPTAEQRAEAIAGTINIILRRAGRRSTRAARLQASRSGGQWATLAGFDVAEPGERLAWQMAGSAAARTVPLTWRNRSTAADGSGPTTLLRDGGLDMLWRGKELTLAPTASLKLANGDTLLLQTQFMRGAVDKDARGYSDTLLGEAEEVVVDTQVTHERNTQARASLEWVHRFAGASSLNLKLEGSGFRRSAEFRQQGYGAAGQPNLDDLTLSGIRERTLRHSGRHAMRLGDRHALVMGWEGERTQRWEDRRQAVRRGAAASTRHFDFDATIDRLALYLQDEWTPDAQLALYLGVRAERVDLQTTGIGFEPVRRSDAVLSPNMQLLWKLPAAPGSQVRAGLSRTFKAPAPRSLIPRPYTSTNNGPLTADERGNPDLRPELALGLDAAVEHHWGRGAMASVGGYLRRIDGVTRDALALEEGRWVSFPVNGGRARLHGLECDTRIKLADLVAGAPALELRLNFTRNWSSVDDLPGPHNRVADQLRWSATLGADWQASEHVGAGISYSYKRAGLTRAALDRYAIAGSRGELDAYALVALAPGVKLRAGVSNALADEQVSGARRIDDARWHERLEVRTMPSIVRVALEFSR